MRIGFDVSQTAERMAGCGIVADQFLRHLVAEGGAHTFIPYPVFGNYRNPSFAKATRPSAPNVVTDQFRLSWSQITAPWESPTTDYPAFLLEPDVIHVNNYSCPRDLGRPIVYTVYDLSAVEAAEFHTEQNRMVCFDGMFDASLLADHFVAISQHSRERFLYWFPHVSPDRVSVVHLAARPSLVGAMTDSTRDRLLGRFGLEADGFWLAVGTIEPRKNYASLLDAYAELRTKAAVPPAPLCIAGLSGWLESSLEPRIQRLGLTDSVRCLGFVTDDELAALYRSCLAFIYPSRYEGFGLPVVEAMACGAAVVVTRSTSLPEVVGDAGWLVDPESAGGFFDAMSTLSMDHARRADLRAAASERAAAFSWRKAAASLLDIYTAVAERSPVLSRSLRS